MAPMLYFTEIACNGWGNPLTCVIQKQLAMLGWMMLSFTLPRGETTRKGRSKAKTIWHDPNHPKLDRATDIIINLINQTNLRGKRVLLLGDSTTTHCIDRQNDYDARGNWVRWRNYDMAVREAMQQRVLAATGVELHHFGESGTSFEGRNNFGYWLERALDERRIVHNTFDAILLVGGWNHEVKPNLFREEMAEELEPILTAFTKKCMDALG